MEACIQHGRAYASGRSARCCHGNTKNKAKQQRLRVDLAEPTDARFEALVHFFCSVSIVYDA